MRQALVILVLIALVSTRSAAQDDALVYGSHIRIHAADERQVREGAFRSLTNDSITYSPGLDTTTETLPLAVVRRVEVSRGMTSVGSTLKGGAIGTLAGAAASGVLIYRCNHGGGELCGLGVAIATPFLLGGGLLVGALVGSGSHTEKWSRVYPRDHDVSLLVGPSAKGGMTVGLSVSFGSADTH
jgi:hypothetical protein